MVTIGILSTGYFEFDNYESGMQKMCEHGYDCIDYQGLSHYADSPLFKISDAEFKEYLTKLKECAWKNRLKIWQLHGIWPHVDDLTAEGRARSIEYFKKNILGAAYLNCPHVVVHPCMIKGWGQGTSEEMFEANVNFLQALRPYAEELGVTVCLENMPFQKGCAFSTIKELKAVIREIDSPFIKICLDTGHLNACKEDMYESILLLGEDLSVLHVHDDQFGQDRHLIPFQGEIDWDKFVKGLRDISFSGCISLETAINRKTPQPILEQMQTQLAKIAKHLANEIN